MIEVLPFPRLALLPGTEEQARRRAPLAPVRAEEAGGTSGDGGAARRYPLGSRAGGALARLDGELRVSQERLQARLARAGNGELRYPEVFRPGSDLQLVLVPMVDVPAGFFLTVDG